LRGFRLVLPFRKKKDAMTPDLKKPLIALFVFALSLLYCTSGRAENQSYQSSGNLETDTQDINTPGQTLSETLVISAPGAVWVRNEHPLITLTAGSLIVIAGKDAVSIKTSAGEVSIPGGLAAMVQQEDSRPVRICMIGVRGKVVDLDNSSWKITVNAGDDIYKLGFGDVLLSKNDKDYSDMVIIHQPPAARKLIREAAHQLNSIALALNVNGVLLADKIANDCTSVLLALAKGNTVNNTDQLTNPVRVFVDNGTKFVAVQDNSIYVPVAFSPTKATTLVAASKK
jgi:transcriptional regulator